MVVVDRAPDPDKRDTVFFGAWVTLLDENEQEKRHRIVGPDEIDAGSDYISMDSPLARLLLKKQLGDEICLIKPDGTETWFEITAVEYEGS